MIKRFNFGDKTKEIWSGDLISECEFICYLPPIGISVNQMLFYDVNFKCFRVVFEEFKDGKSLLNGWRALSTPSDLLK